MRGRRVIRMAVRTNRLDVTARPTCPFPGAMGGILLLLLALTLPAHVPSAGDQPGHPQVHDLPALPQRPYRLPEDPAVAKVLWQLPLTGRPRAVHPLLVEGRLVFSDASRRVRAVDAATGREIWSLEAEAEGIGHGAGTIYLSEWKGAITAVDATSGEVRWRFGTGGEAVG